MNIPEIVHKQVQQLSRELNVPLAISRCWNNEFGEGHHCRVNTVLLDAPQLRIEIDGLVAVGTATDCVDLSLLVNDQCVAPVQTLVETKAIAPPSEEDELETTDSESSKDPRLDFQPAAYLHREEGGEFVWDDLDEGFFHRIGIDATLLRSEFENDFNAAKYLKPNSAADLLKRVAPLSTPDATVE